MEIKQVLDSPAFKVKRASMSRADAKEMDYLRNLCQKLVKMKNYMNVTIAARLATALLLIPAANRDIFKSPNTFAL